MNIRWIVAPLVLLGALFLAAPAPAQYNTPYSMGAPPARHQSDNAAVTVFTTDVSRFCGEVPLGYNLIACTQKPKDRAPVLVLPNPCLFPDEVFAHIACHELGHRNGWGGNHEE